MSPHAPLSASQRRLRRSASLFSSRRTYSIVRSGICFGASITRACRGSRFECFTRYSLDLSDDENSVAGNAQGLDSSICCDLHDPVQRQVLGLVVPPFADVLSNLLLDALWPQTGLREPTLGSCHRCVGTRPPSTGPTGPTVPCVALLIQISRGIGTGRLLGCGPELQGAVPTGLKWPWT